MPQSESERVKQVYQKREEKELDKRYSFFRGENLLILQERERVLLSMLKHMVGTLKDKRILDVGCGTGGTLLPFMLYGAAPVNCFGVDILESHIETTRQRLPNMTFECCSGDNIPFEKGGFDLVTMFTLLSSVLDNNIRRRICQQALTMLCPGGWVLIYDFRVNNPFNPDVKAVTLKELKQYFRCCKYYTKTLTLLPQLGRAIGPYSLALCSLMAKIPLLRTHRMTMFQKPCIVEMSCDK